MKLPDKFPEGTRFRESDGGSLFAFTPTGIFLVSDGELFPRDRGPSSRPFELSEEAFFRKAHAEIEAAKKDSQ